MQIEKTCPFVADKSEKCIGSQRERKEYRRITTHTQHKHTMVNQDNFEAMSRQRKGSLPIIIPINKRSTSYNNARNNTYDTQQYDGEGDNTTNNTLLRNNSNNDVYYGDDDDEDDEDIDDFITFRAPSVEPPSPVKHEPPRYTRNLIQKSRKASVIFGSKPNTFFNSVKKKKSSSGVSSSSSDNNFPLHGLSDRDEGAFEDDRKISDISIDELSSSESSPSVSRRSSGKRLSETKEDLGYSSMREKTVPRNSSAYHLNLTNKLKESTSKKIGLWNEKITSQQKADSQNRSIYSLHGTKRRSKTTIEKNETPEEPPPTSFSRRNTGTFVTNYEEKLKTEPKIKTRQSLSEKVSSFFGKKKSQDQSNTLTNSSKKRSSTLTVPEPEKVVEKSEIEVNVDQPSEIQICENEDVLDDEEKTRSRRPSRKISQNLQVTTQQLTQLRRFSECSRNSKDDERKLSFAEIQRKFSATIAPSNRQRVNLVDQSTQTEVSNRLMVHNVNNPQLPRNVSEVFQPKAISPTLKLRRSSLPVSMGYPHAVVKEYEGFTPFEPYSTIDEFDEHVPTRSKSACRCNFEPDTDNMFIEQIRREQTKPSHDNNKREGSVKQTLPEEDDMDFDNEPINQVGEEAFDYFQNNEDNEEGGEDDDDTTVSLPSWQKQALSTKTTVEPKTRRFSFNPPPTHSLPKQPLRRNKSHDLDRKRSICYNILNPPWYQNTMPITPDIFVNALSTSLSYDETSHSQSLNESYDDHPSKVSVIHRPDLSRISLDLEGTGFNLNELEKKPFHTLEDLKEGNLLLYSDKPRSSTIHKQESRERSKSNVAKKDEEDVNQEHWDQDQDKELIEPMQRPRKGSMVLELNVPGQQDEGSSPTCGGNQRRRKFGVMHLHALDSLPQRRRSVYQHERKTSTAFGSIAHPFLQFDQSDDIEIVSDQNTLNVIVDSYDALNMDIDIASGTSFIKSVPRAPDNNITNSSVVLFQHNHLDNLDEEEQEVEPRRSLQHQQQQQIAGGEDFENAVGFIERKTREMLRTSQSTKEHIDSPKSRRKGIKNKDFLFLI